MSKNLQEVGRKFGNKIIGKRAVKKLVCSVVSLLNAKQVDFVTSTVWFVNSFPDAWGFVFRGDELKGKFIVFLSDELFRQPKVDQVYEVAHELAHILLSHRNSIGTKQSKTEIADQEKEADRFARNLIGLPN